MNAPTLRFRTLPPPGSRVAVALSGGVDSSLCARLLVEQGCSIVGVTMRVAGGAALSASSPGGSCYSGGEEADLAACKRLCDELGAPWELVDLSREYEAEVLEYFRREYLAGRTPNPCLRCNPLLKFGLLPAAIAARGIAVDWYATGHYVRILEEDIRVSEEDTRIREEVTADSSTAKPPAAYLATAMDGAKDQSYFLQRLDASVLQRLVFPLGGMRKSEVRALARERGLEAADKPDSQDFASREDLPIIFGDRGGKTGSFVRRRPDGSREVLGQHRGLEFYTIGQRRGLGLAVDSTPLYVLALDAAHNEVVVGSEDELFESALVARDAVWQAGLPPEGGVFRALAKIRLATPASPATVRIRPDGGVEVAFDTPLRAITAGQSVAFYLPVENKNIAADPALPAGELFRFAGPDRLPEGAAQPPSLLALVGGAVIEHAGLSLPPSGGTKAGSDQKDGSPA